MSYKKRVKFANPKLEPRLMEAQTKLGTLEVIGATSEASVDVPALSAACPASIAHLSSSSILIEEGSGGPSTWALPSN